MSTYDLWRHFADSWALLAMFAFIVATTLFVFRPGSKAQYDEAAQIPLKHGSED